MATKYNLKLKNNLPILVKEKSYKVDNLCHPKDVADFFMKTIGLQNAAEEYCYTIGLNSDNHVVGIFEISHGTVNMSLVSPREIMIRMLLCGAVRFITIHNHPSGNLNESIDDIKICKRLKDAGEIINCQIIDFIIIGRRNGEYCSFRERGKL